MPVAKCPACSKKFHRKLSQLNRSKISYCSAKCQHDSRKTGRLIPCHLCGKKSYKAFRHLSRYTNFFCSKKCSITWQNTTFIGTKHPNWKTGEFSYRGVLLQNKIPAICILCKITDRVVLAVHHIDKNRKNNTLSNLAWLCRNCHFLVHHYPEENRKFERTINHGKKKL